MGNHTSDATSPQVLVVDDDPQFVRLLSTWLKRANYQVTHAFSGTEALNALGCANASQEPGACPFDLVVLDVMMPGPNGTEVCRQIRANPNTAQMPVLILTALTSSEERIEALEAGANDFITKPFQGVELLARVDNLIRWRRAELEAQVEIRRRNRELSALNQIASTLNQTLNLLDLLRQTLSTVCQVTGLSWGAIHLLDHTDHYLELAAHLDAPLAILDGWRRIPRDAVAPSGVSVPRTQPADVMWQVIDQMQPIAAESITLTDLDAPTSPALTIVTCNYVLLAAKGQPMGLLTIGDSDQQAPSEEMAQLLGAIGHQIGAAIANAILFERLRRHSFKLDALNQITGLMMSRLDLAGVLSAIVEGLVDYWNVAAAHVWLLERDAGEEHLVLRAQSGLISRLNGDGTRIPLDKETLLGRLAIARQEQLCIDLHRDVELIEQDWVDRERLRCFVGYPLIHGSQLAGILTLFSSAVLDQSDFDLLRTLANQATVAIENARLYAREQQRVAELTSLTRELERSQAQLIQSEKLAVAGRLAASLAHEINNPLQAIHNCITLTQRFPLEEREHVDFLKLAGKEVERLIGIVQRMLEFYRPSRSQRAPTDINALIEHVVALSEKKLQHSDIELQLDLAPNLPLVPAVADQISQVILNLIINAIEAMPEGGQLKLVSRQSGEWVEISTTDSGPGLSPEQIDHVFEPFFTTKPGGTGLGLAISFGIVERHGGTIQVTSTPGAGATFTVRWPITSEGAGSA